MLRSCQQMKIMMVWCEYQNHSKCAWRRKFSMANQTIRPGVWLHLDEKVEYTLHLGLG